MNRTRVPSRHVVHLSTGSGLVAAYDDGQVWAHDAQVLRRVEMWERLNPASHVDEATAGSFPFVAPNPSSGPTTISFSLAKPGWTSVQIFDAGGRVVRVLGVGEMSAGQHAMAWDGRSDAGEVVATGVYFSRVQSRAGVMNGRVVRR
ncbi:MAG: T9SS type A sorting domain-containing protein [Candidatus Eisenbacteria bacterium]|nr:T9SS type A sorting domain-containing protein [Candidatus Eisenbacteria bacterium]